MKNWTAIAKAGGVEIPAEDLERISRTLDSLEAAFRPLARSLTSKDESAIVFQAQDGGQ